MQKGRMTMETRRKIRVCNRGEVHEAQLTLLQFQSGDRPEPRVPLEKLVRLARRNPPNPFSKRLVLEEAVSQSRVQLRPPQGRDGPRSGQSVQRGARIGMKDRSEKVELPELEIDPPRRPTRPPRVSERNTYLH
jgi:hypothetical protein